MISPLWAFAGSESELKNMPLPGHRDEAAQRKKNQPNSQRMCWKKLETETSSASSQWTFFFFPQKILAEFWALQESRESSQSLLKTGVKPRTDSQCLGNRESHRQGRKLKRLWWWFDTEGLKSLFSPASIYRLFPQLEISASRLCLTQGGSWQTGSPAEILGFMCSWNDKFGDQRGLKLMAVLPLKTFAKFWSWVGHSVKQVCGDFQESLGFF